MSSYKPNEFNGSAWPLIYSVSVVVLIGVVVVIAVVTVVDFLAYTALTVIN